MTNLIGVLISLRNRRGLRRLVKELLALYGVEVPPEVKIGAGLLVVHRGFGVVIHKKTAIGSRVVIYHGVTIGRADAHLPAEVSPMERIEIGDDVMLFPGAKVLGGSGVTRVGDGTVLGANAVLTTSTGDWEIWAGIPARKIGDRPRTHHGVASSGTESVRPPSPSSDSPARSAEFS